MLETLRFDVFNVQKNYLITKLPDKQLMINTINAYSWIVTTKNEEFQDALQASDVLLPDGVSIVIAARLIYRTKIKKVAGADLHKMLLDVLNRQSGRCFYLGASDDVLLAISKRNHIEYPNVSTSTYSPPFKKQFSEKDNQIIVDKINQFEPDIVFVGMTAPKQEVWINANKNKLQTKIICGIGAVFDFYAGTKKRPPKWMINMGLEWLGRLIDEPRRLWKRYLIYNFLFLIKMLKLLFQVRI